MITVRALPLVIGAAASRARRPHLSFSDVKAEFLALMSTAYFPKRMSVAKSVVLKSRWPLQFVAPSVGRILAAGQKAT